MEPTDAAAFEPNTLENYLNQPDQYSIYTHSPKTRTTVLLIFTAYLVFFSLFVRRAQSYILEIHDAQAAMRIMGEFEAQNWLIYIVTAAAVLAAFLFFIYLFWALIDVWGLQVWVSKTDLRVQNTIAGNALRRWTGVGSLTMEEIKRLRGGKIYTYVLGDHKGVRFSPVDQVDLLLETIMRNAKDVTIEDKET